VLQALGAFLPEMPHVHLRDPDSPCSSTARSGSADTSEQGEPAGRYQLLEEIARGGMGAVLKGRDTDLGRDLAIKVLLEQHKDHPELVRRFIEEAQIAGQLQHPGVVPIHELGAFPDQRPYFAMKLVKGRTMAALLDERHGPADEQPKLLGILEQVCLTMAYAHARGVIHRDLKPSNIMVGSFGEVQVMDWGLAKVLPQGGAAEDRAATEPPHDTVIVSARGAGDLDASVAGSVMGTPAYMAPEQARGAVDRLDERTDVFALGSILCEVLTGKPAFTGRSGDEVRRKAAQGDTSEACARLDQSGTDAELAALVQCCLRTEPEDRPRDAGEVARRLTAYLAGVQERLRRAELARVEAQARAEEEAKQRTLADALAQKAREHAREEGRRRRLQVGLAAALLVLTTLCGLGTTIALQQRQARTARVALALNELRLLHDQAHARADDPSQWQAAQEAVKRVELALGDSDDTPARRNLAALRTAVAAGAAAAQRDRDLLETLADLRSAKIDLGLVGTEAAYSQAFRRAGIDLDTLPLERAAAMLRDRPPRVTQALASVLDDWAGIRHSTGQPPERWRKPLELARAADPDPYRGRVRDLVEGENLKDQREALRTLAQDPQAATLPPTSTLLLASALRHAGDLPAAAAVLERAVPRYPDDVWINYNLGVYLDHLPVPRRDDALRYLTAARALRPESAHDLAHLIDQMGRSEEAVAAFRALVAIRPTDHRHLGCFGKLLLDLGRRDEALDALDRAIAATRAAIARWPGDGRLHHALGFALQTRGDRPAAALAYREALRLEPQNFSTRNSLLNLLRAMGDTKGVGEVEGTAVPPRARANPFAAGPDRVIADTRAALLVDPHVSPGYIQLARALEVKGDIDGAIAAIREAIRRSPDRFAAFSYLGVLLRRKGDLDGAIAAAREAIRIRPDLVKAHVELGLALRDKGDRDGAVAAFRAALAIQPDLRTAHVELMTLLRSEADPRKGVAWLDELIAGHPDEPRLYVARARYLAQLGQPTRAAADLAEANRLRPDDPLLRKDTSALLPELDFPDDPFAPNKN